MVCIELIGMDVLLVLVVVVCLDLLLGFLLELFDLINMLLVDLISKVVLVVFLVIVFMLGVNVLFIDSVLVAEDIFFNNCWLFFNELMYFMVGYNNGDINVCFQLSFKFCVFVLDDLCLCGLLDNFYLGYMQFLLWDLLVFLVFFCDISYCFSLYYYLLDVGIQNCVFSCIGIVIGLEYEFNGCDGMVLCSINIYFIELIFNFGNFNDYYFKVVFKVYVYFGLICDNLDIVDYCGYLDLKLVYGKFDGVEVVIMLCKGKLGGKYSVEIQVIYLFLCLLFGIVGYLMVSYFYGYGESLLIYNQKDYL